MASKQMRQLLKAVKDADPDEIDEAIRAVGGKSALNNRELGFVSWPRCAARSLKPPHSNALHIAC
jgi:hypothetical protein